ncbi:transcriptional regulator/sugar kinase [Cylindrospermum stagnale PCC 7417]|uniref:Transcriptional regulator/sugar kinase n=1 Tax=Cylindrospermum stagnale PCC 7417 TaxID=56107 RepID=K9WXY9_9NOST|nr:ROK family protein [Cylindrospermum stagnale]AFZ24666.1 transcriptional regulator/sugar kinase [Cylindrospermum stagnale PCC 7417]
MVEDNGSVRTLSVDIGGSGVKAMVLDIAGKPLTERARLETPQPAKPEVVINAIVVLAAAQGDFHRVSVGFPGVVRCGVTETAVNLHPDWIGCDLATTLSKQLNKPVRVINDADMQGLGAIAGKGVELVVTLGTGFGSALFIDGKLVPNMEMGHHQFRKGETYEEQLRRAALEQIGEKKWNRRLEKAIASLQHLFNYDYLYIGGGEAVKVNMHLPLNVKLIPNVTGLLGGIALWKD